MTASAMVLPYCLAHVRWKLRSVNFPCTSKNIGTFAGAHVLCPCSYTCLYPSPCPFNSHASTTPISHSLPSPDPAHSWSRSAVSCRCTTHTWPPCGHPTLWCLERVAPLWVLGRCRLLEQPKHQVHVEHKTLVVANIRGPSSTYRKSELCLTGPGAIFSV